MVTIDKVGGSSDAKHSELFGNSTDTKPTDVNVNDIFVELDTGDGYYWDGSQWRLVGG